MEHLHQEQFCLSCSLNKIIPLLPHQGPIKDFIAGVRIPLFVDKPFDDALALGARVYGARSYMDLSYYRCKYKNNIISDDMINRAVLKNFPSSNKHDRTAFGHALFNFVEVFDEKSFHVLAKKNQFSAPQISLVKREVSRIFSDTGDIRTSLYDQINQQLPRKIQHEVNAILFRLLGSYLDQGVSLWPFIDEKINFVDFVRTIASASVFPIVYFANNKKLANYLTMPIDVGIHHLLKKIIGPEHLFSDYLEQSLLDHPGWSGMIHSIAERPDALAKRRTISLPQLMLVKLALEWQFINQITKDYLPLGGKEVINASRTTRSNALSLAYWLLSLPKNLRSPQKNIWHAFTIINLQKIWHEAFEETYYQNIADKLTKTEQLPPAQGVKKFQTIFCIDDRECSFRRHLESVSDVETFSSPGFFGIDCYYKPHKKDILEKMCPVPVTPRHVVMEKVVNEDNNGPDQNLLEFASFISRHGANSIFFGFISAYTLGHLSLFRLIFGFFHPFKMVRTRHLTIAADRTELMFERVGDEETSEGGLYFGYTHREMATRVFNTLRNIGLVENFAPLVFAIGHGSSSVNNPHFAAYDCGACSGRPGAVNARIFAAMANMPVVRTMIAQKGMTIPEGTTFIGGFHDTCTDDIRLFDLDKIPADKMPLFNEFQENLHIAKGKNAVERCRRFALVKKDITPEEALTEVHHRARALFEPRPELGHATNALCIVGRRARTLDKNFDRRAFLQSYDPYLDPQGEILSSLMGALIPVCGGINLEYYFSRIDPAIYGCGTKLSHNVCSLIGVGNGLDDDLRAGLPIQMTELHEPIRLLVIIEQKPEIIRRAVLEKEAFVPWIKHQWIKIASLDPDQNTLEWVSLAMKPTRSIIP